MTTPPPRRLHRRHGPPSALQDSRLAYGLFAHSDNSGLQTRVKCGQVVSPRRGSVFPTRAVCLQKANDIHLR
ncbi:unnamed protein product, partial [Mycena citricolor]